MEFEIDFGNLVAPANPTGPLFASIDGRVANLDAGECVFVPAGSRDRHVMTHDVLRAMDAMRTFRPLGEHEQAIENALPSLQGRTADIKRVCEYLTNRGLLIGADAMVDAALEQRSEPGAAPVLVVRTCDRPELLARLLESLPPALREGDVLVMDDSRKAASVEANRGSVAALGSRAALVDRAWRKRLVARLAADLEVPEPLLHSTIGAEDGFAPGAVWNAATLLTAGRRVLFLDDDWSWEPRKLRGAGLNIGLDTNQYSTMRLALADNWTEQLTEPSQRDWVTDLSRLLGGTVGDLAAFSGTPLGADKLAGKTWQEADRLLVDSTIRSLCAGCYGDSTASNPLWYYLLDPRNAGDFATADERTYHRFLARPRFVRGFDRVQLSAFSPYTPTGFDNRTLMPPTAPTGRGEDLAFAAFVRYLYPRSLAAHVPLLLQHRRPEGHPPQYPEAFTPAVSRFFAEYAIAHGGDCLAEHPEARLANLGHRFEDLAGAPERDRVATLAEFSAYLQSQVVSQLQQTLQRHTQPSAHFARDAKEWLEANGKALTDGRLPLLDGWSTDLDESACAARFAGEAQIYSDMFEWWPAAWHALSGEYQATVAL